MAEDNKTDASLISQTIKKVLKKDERLWNEENEVLNETFLLELVEDIDERVINLLIEEKTLREKFFIKIRNVYVFKTNEFRFFIEENKVDNSYTAYANRIGLTDGKKFLKDTNDIVLDFPYKDCVLEGGQSTEEGTDLYFEYDETVNKTQEKQGMEAGKYNKKTTKREEIFFNQVLAHEEIDRLFDPKALVNWKMYTKDEIEEVRELKRDKDGTIKENLIIKGNNLLALHSIKKQFVGKIKLIYIDPPYYFKDTKAEDAFAYNSNFKLSTWLTFMKNRLDVAKELLRDDGVIFIQINDEGHAYLKILMDEIFDNNFVNAISVKMSDLSGPKMAHLDKKFPKLKENLLLYKKNNINLNKISEIKTVWDTEYKNYLENFNESDYNFISNFDYEKDSLDELNNKLKSIEIIPLNEKLKELDVEGLNTADKEKKYYEFCLKNSFRIARTSNSTSLKKILDNLLKEYNQKIVAIKSPTNKLALCITTYNKESNDPRVQLVFAKDTLENPLGDLWMDINTSGLHTEGGVTMERGKKPEKLLEYVIKSSTNKGDIVLDYHLGSGTTCAVAHKLERQYIGIEQLDYGENDSVIRLQNVINGDQTGISKSVKWQGGGNFIYLELAKWNEVAKEKILECKDLKELLQFFDEMYEKYFLNYNLKIKEFKEKIIQEEEFKKLSLEEQKKIFIAMLDNNQMYVNMSEMADKRYGISKEDEDLSRKFYEGRK